VFGLLFRNENVTSGNKIKPRIKNTIPVKKTADDFLKSELGKAKYPLMYCYVVNYTW